MTRYLPTTVMYLDTSSGSRYRIDPFARRWERLSHDARSNLLRTEGGRLWGLERQPRVGEQTVIYGPPLGRHGMVRMLATTTIVRIWDREPDAPHSHVPRWFATN